MKSSAGAIPRFLVVCGWPPSDEGGAEGSEAEGETEAYRNLTTSERGLRGRREGSWAR